MDWGWGWFVFVLLGGEFVLLLGGVGCRLWSHLEHELKMLPIAIPSLPCCWKGNSRHW